MRSLEELRHKVWSSRSLWHLDESIAAYNAGAYRSAILSTWVATLFDLIEKVRILSDNDESEAKKQRQYLDGAIESRNISQLQSFERNALDIANDLELIGTQEKIQLERLRDDRNICAHPGYLEGSEELFSPGPDLVRAHIVAAVESLLAHPPVTGRKAIARFEREIQEQSFPEGFDKLESYLRAAYLDHGSNALKANLCKVVLKQCMQVSRTEDAAVAGRLSATVRVLAFTVPAEFEENLETFLLRRQDTFNDDQLLMFAASIGRAVSAWHHLNNGASGRLERRIEMSSFAELISDHALFQPIPDGPIGDLVVKRFECHLNDHPPESYSSHIATVARNADSRVAFLFCDRLDKASQFRHSEMILTYLVDCSRVISGKHIHGIARAYLNNQQVWKAFNAPGILHELWIRTNHSKDQNIAWGEFVKEVNNKLENCQKDDESYWKAVLDEVGPNAPPF